MALPDPVFARFPNRASRFSLAPSVITEAPRSKAQFVRAPADTAGVVVGHPELVLRLRMSLRGPPGRRRRWSHRVVPGDRHPSPPPGGARYTRTRHPDGRRLFGFMWNLSDTSSTAVAPRLIVITNWQRVLEERLGIAGHQAPRPREPHQGVASAGGGSAAGAAGEQGHAGAVARGPSEGRLGVRGESGDQPAGTARPRRRQPRSRGHRLGDRGAESSGSALLWGQIQRGCSGRYCERG